MSEILQPCPFCGGTKICTEKGINLNYCDNCSAESNIEHWNTRPIEDDLRKRIAELEGKIDQLTAHSDIERQDDKSSNDTQKETFVYGKDSKPLPCPFCGKLPYDDVLF